MSLSTLELLQFVLVQQVRISHQFSDSPNLDMSRFILQSTEVNGLSYENTLKYGLAGGLPAGSNLMEIPFMLNISYPLHGMIAHIEIIVTFSGSAR